MGSSTRATPLGPSYKAGDVKPTLVRELFIEGGALTREQNSLRVASFPPVEVLPRVASPCGDHDFSREWVVGRGLDRARREWYRGASFAPPMHTSSSIWNFNRQCTRPPDFPEGNGTSIAEVRGNATLLACIRIACKVYKERVSPSSSFHYVTLLIVFGNGAVLSLNVPSGVFR